MRTTPIILMTFVLLGAAAGAKQSRSGGDEHLTAEEISLIFGEFRHETHDEVFVEENLGCLACHPVGGRIEGESTLEDPYDLFTSPPPASCHYCHRTTDDREAIGPEGCQNCHGQGYQPETHGPGWVDFHGTEVRMIRPGCQDCHDTGQCISCHDNRGALSRSNHPPGWGAVHGVEARFDPQACVTCHVGDGCVQCHQRGRSPW